MEAKSETAILIVDDELNVRELLGFYLAREGYRTRAVSDLDEARRALAEDEYQLVTLDIDMPGGSGIDLLKEIRTEYPDTAVLMVTVINSTETAKQAVENGAYGYIRKPFESEEVLIGVHSALRRRELELVNRSYLANLEDEVGKRTWDLAKSEDRFRRLVEKMTEGLAAIDPERRFTYVNRRFGEMLGYEKDELIGHFMDEFVDPAYLKTMKAELDKRRIGGEDRYELIWRTRSRKSLHTIVSPTALFDEAGNFQGGFGIVTDITDLKRVEAALKKELNTSRALAETAGWLVSSARLGEISERILEKTERLTESRFGFVGYVEPGTGRLAAPTMSKTTRELCRVKGGGAAFNEPMGLWGWVILNRKPLITNHAAGDERALGVPDGHVPIERFLGVPALLGDQLVGMIGLANPERDYTDEDLRIVQPYADLYAVALDRKRHEEETKNRKNYLRDILDSVAAGIMVIDRETHVIKEANPTAVKMVGAPKEEIIGRECWNFICPAQKYHCPVTDENKEEEYSERVVVNTRGLHIPVIKTVAPIMISGRPHLLETFVDIAEQKKMEFKLAQAQKLEAIGQLAAGIAHEINTPMQYIQGNIEFLEEALGSLGRLVEEVDSILKGAAMEGSVPGVVQRLQEQMEQADIDFYREEVPEAVAGSLEGVERISRIVDSMRYFAHPGKLEKSRVDLNETIENALTISRNQWKYYARATTDLDPELPEIQAYAPELNQVLLNLIVNAAHAVAEVHGEKKQAEGLIHISSRRADGQVELRVQDNGAGIPLEHRARIFDPFFTTKEVGKGTGQGLAISYNIIVEKHGGAIDFETEPGRGSTFIIRLPFDPNP